MSNTSGGILGIILIGLKIAIPIIVGIKTWNWIDPDSFWGAIKFLIAWSVITAIVEAIIIGLGALLANHLNSNH